VSHLDSLSDFRSLLNNGVGDIDAKCRAEQASSLHWAAYFGHTQMLLDLIRKKADVNTLHKKLDTPLHVSPVYLPSPHDLSSACVAVIHLPRPLDRTATRVDCTLRGIACATLQRTTFA
jgi:hypothetical protein